MVTKIGTNLFWYLFTRMIRSRSIHVSKEKEAVWWHGHWTRMGFRFLLCCQIFWNEIARPANKYCHQVVSLYEAFWVSLLTTSFFVDNTKGCTTYTCGSVPSGIKLWMISANHLCSKNEMWLRVLLESWYMITTGWLGGNQFVYEEENHWCSRYLASIRSFSLQNLVGCGKFWVPSLTTKQPGLCPDTGR